MSERTPLVELLGAYLPSDRLQALADGRDLPSLARGVVLFADISGFTPISEALERELGSRRGGEELTRHLNEVYGALIEEVQGAQGSVIGFSGDAITCWFERERPAAACALRLQEVMGRLGAVARASGGTSLLGIKVAATFGQVRRFVVGDPAVQLLDVLSGDVVERVGRGEALAERGEVLVEEGLIEALGEGAIVDGWRVDQTSGGRFGRLRELRGVPDPAPSRRADLGGLSADELRPWLLPPVYEHLCSGQGDFLAELRPAVAFFLRFQGLNFDADPAAPGKLDAFVRWAQGIFEHYGGSLIQLTTGDKGSYLYAAFGAPTAHEDVAERALSAALALRSPPDELAFIERTQIGISAGYMRCGAYGGPLRRTYGVLGDETNVAARLMMKAEAGQILVSQRVAEAGAGAYRFEALGSVALKGKSSPLPLFALTGRVDGGRGARRAGLEHPIVGREGERALLRAAVDALAGGEGFAIVIEGEAGIGKSHLAADVVGYALAKADPAPRCLTAGADPIEHATSYYAWRAVFAELLGVDRGRGAEAAAAQVAARLPPTLASLAALLGPVLEIELPETPASAQLTGTLRAAKTPPFLAAVFKALAGDRPVLLRVEDAHWLDSSSWALLEQVRRAMPTLGLVLTSRPVATPHAPYEALRAAPATRLLALEALPPADAAALARRRLGVRELPAEVAALIQEKAEGNPFFTEELCLALRDAGFIRVEGGVCHVDRPLDGVQFPDTIEGVVTSRIDRLAPAEQLTLKVASVVGRTFEGPTLQEVFPVVEERGRLPSFLDTLERLDLTPRDRGAPTYVFKHAVTLDVSYNLMLFEQRRALHAALADWYERTHANDLSPFYPLLAHHRLRAVEGVADPDEGALARAVDASAKAGKQSLERGATPEALMRLSDGLRLVAMLPPSRRRSSLELELRVSHGAVLAVMRGPTHDEVRREFERARELCRELGETSRVFEAVFGLWYSHLTGSEREGAVEFSRQLLEIAGLTHLPSHVFLARQACGATAVFAGDHAEGLAHIQEALAAFLGAGMAARPRPRSEPPAAGVRPVPADLEYTGGFSGGLSRARDPLVMAYCYCASAGWFLGNPTRALKDLERAIAIAGEVTHPLTLVQALCFAALVHRYRREPERTEAYILRAQALAAEHGFPYWLGVVSSVLGWLRLERGDAEGAAAQLRGGVAREREQGILPMTRIFVLSDLVEALTRLGRLDEAREALDEAKATLETKLAGFGAPEVHRQEAVLWLAGGDRARAEEAFRRALEIAREQGSRSLALRAAVGLGRLLLGQGRPAIEPLASIYASFTEGHETADLVEARALLATLGAPPPP